MLEGLATISDSLPRPKRLKKKLYGITWPDSSSPAGPRRAHSLDLVEVDADVIVRVVALHCHVYGSLVDARRLGQLPVLLQITCEDASRRKRKVDLCTAGLRASSALYLWMMSTCA